LERIDMALTDPVSPHASDAELHRGPVKEPFLLHQRRILGALVIREMNTRFGRDGIGFVWIVVEPLAFCFGVLIMWSLIKPEYEHGVRLAPFVMSGYMSLIMMRHYISQFMNALQANVGLMHHRQIAPVHFYIARACLEFLGTSAAFIVVYVILIALDQVGPPKDYLSIYAGWLTVSWVGIGFALVLAGLAMKFEAMERIVPLIGYILVPVSGAFTMVAWIPSSYRDIFLLFPFAHGIELIRHGIFGEFVATYYDIPYALFVGTIMNIIGLLLVAAGREELDVD
jgi:capsular polysaccharide transport system permease protein